MIRKNLVHLLGLLITLLLIAPTVSAQGWHSQSMTSAVKRSAGKSPSKSRDASSKQYASKGGRNSKAAGSKESSKTAESKKSVESSQPTSTSSGKTKSPTTENSSKSGTAATSTRERTVTKTSGHNKATGRCDPEKHQLSDLSGTYHGVVNYPDGGFSGDATLTITGNQFLLVVGNAAQTGRITAVTTCSYTAATMMFGESKSAEPGKPSPPPLPVISLRATKKANDLVLATIEGERRTFSFAPKTSK